MVKKLAGHKIEQSDIAVLSQYRAQCSDITSRLQHLGLRQVTISTVIAAQGLSSDSAAYCQVKLTDVEYTPCLKENRANLFLSELCHISTNVEIFGTKIAKRTSFSEVYSFSTSPNLRQHTTVLNADVPNCYITL